MMGKATKEEGKVQSISCIIHSKKGRIFLKGDGKCLKGKQGRDFEFIPIASCTLSYNFSHSVLIPC